MPFSLLLLGALGALAGCGRTPPEPTPSSPPSVTVAVPTVASAVTPSASVSAASAVTPPASSVALANRCVTPLSAQAPTIPPVASLKDCPRDPDGIPKLPTAVVSFPGTPGAPNVDVELALNPHESERGLMYRRSMPENHGMLFRLGAREEHTFWMHNTCMPLDIMFVDEDGLVVGISEAATPLTDTGRTVKCASTHVLEVNAGWARRHGVRPGQTLSIPAAAR